MIRAALIKDSVQLEPAYSSEVQSITITVKGVKTDLMLEELRVLHLDPQAAEGDWKCDLRAPAPQGHTSSNKPHLLVMPLPMDQALGHMSLWGTFVFKPPQHPVPMRMLWMC